MAYPNSLPLLPKPIKAVFLDFDGVLLDSEILYQRFWKEAFKEFGYEAPKEILLKLRSCDAAIGEKIMSSFFQEPFPYEKVRARRKELMSAYLRTHEIPLKKGALSFLKYLKNNAILAYIVSSSPKSTISYELKKRHIDSYIDDVLSAKEVKKGKPYPDVYLKALETSRLKRSEVLVFEDSPNGIESAYRAGLNVVMVDDLDSADLETSKKIILEVTDLSNIQKRDLFSRT